MKDKNDVNLKRMSRGALLEMLLEQADELEQLQSEKEELKKKAEAGLRAEAMRNAEREQYKANLAVIRAKVERNIAALQKHTVGLEERIRILTAENEDLRKRSSDGDPGKIAALQAERDSARKELSDLRAALEKRIAELEEKLRNSEAEAVELRRKPENAVASADAESLRRERSEKAGAAQEAEEESAALRQKTENLPDELSELRRRRWKRGDKRRNPQRSVGIGSKSQIGGSAEAAVGQQPAEESSPE